jgi:hypothetical protein
MTDQVEDTGNDDAAERVEAEARRQGWRPQDEYTGPAKQWVDAETFVERGKEIRQFTKKENDELRRKLADATTRLEEQGKTIEEIREYHAGMEKRAIDAAVSRLKAERKQALAEGDMVLADTLDEEIDELKTAKSAVPGKAAAEAAADKGDDDAAGTQGGAIVPKGEVPKAVTDWLEANRAWYNDDAENEDLVAYTNGLAARLAGRRDMTPEERVEELDVRLRKTFPDRFGTRKKAALTSGAGEGGGAQGSRKSSKSVAALPAEARAAGERYVKQKLYKNMEEYAAEYFAQPGA